MNDYFACKPKEPSQIPMCMEKGWLGAKIQSLLNPHILTFRPIRIRILQACRKGNTQKFNLNVFHIETPDKSLIRFIVLLIFILISKLHSLL